MNNKGKGIHPSVILYPNVTIGKNVIIKANSVIGGDGFGYSKDKNGVYVKQKHYGGVVIEDNVEIGSCVCVDRAVEKGTNTIIGKGTKIDNLVHIAHCDVMGKNCAIVAGVSLGGSVVLEDRVFVGLNAIIKPKVKVGHDAVIGMGAVVLDDVSPGTIVVGNPAKFLRMRDGYKE
jgi:UDP-3-O-[3-hydroxymyristoyl] glucosamine N-acyltransferase